MNERTKDLDPVTTALLLAAGTGSRLYPLTKDEPKCMTSVNIINDDVALIDLIEMNKEERI